MLQPQKLTEWFVHQSLRRRQRRGLLTYSYSYQLPLLFFFEIENHFQEGCTIRDEMIVVNIFHASLFAVQEFGGEERDG